MPSTYLMKQCILIRHFTLSLNLSNKPNPSIKNTHPQHPAPSPDGSSYSERMHPLPPPPPPPPPCFLAQRSKSDDDYLLLHGLQYKLSWLSAGQQLAVPLWKEVRELILINLWVGLRPHHTQAQWGHNPLSYIVYPLASRWTLRGKPICLATAS